MSKAFLCIPSARPPAEANIALARWKSIGYGIALWCVGDSNHHGKICDVKLTGPKYPGWAASINILADCVLRQDPQCDWIVGGGDDTYPDPTHSPELIAAECYKHFGANYFEARDMHFDIAKRMTLEQYSTFGVMQPTGDRWNEGVGWPDKDSAPIDRIAGSPFMGREWCKRINQGHGPMWPEYPHNWADEELQCVAQKQGVFWQRRDLTHYHDHPLRKPGATEADWPPHLKWVTADYGGMASVFRQRKAEGFPGSEPL